MNARFLCLFVLGVFLFSDGYTFAQCYPGLGECGKPSVGTQLGGRQEEWILNNSIMIMKSDGNMLQFFYKHPRDELREYGIREGTLNFEGTLAGTALSGLSYIYSQRCGQVGFHAEGTFDSNYVVLFGIAPSGFDDRCQATSSRNDKSAYHRLGVN
jgi:hypothetical protein